MQLNDCHITIQFNQRRRMSMSFNCDDVIAIKLKKKIRFADVTAIFSVIIKSFKSAIFTVVSDSTFRFCFSVNDIVASFANHKFLDVEIFASVSYKSIEHFNHFSINRLRRRIAQYIRRTFNHRDFDDL